MTQADWTRGYYTNEGYIYGVYPEILPQRLHLHALLLNHNVPSSEFKYLELGCGQGFNIVLAAALHPDSRFVGVDFMPTHIAHARALAKNMGLTNVDFLEADFATVAQDLSQYGKFAYIAAHGIISWISPESKAALLDIVGEFLSLEGVAYLSYNTLPGWLPMIPFQKLVSEFKVKEGADRALVAAREFHNVADTLPSAFTKLLPSSVQSASGTEKHDISYLKQEYANQYWLPFWSIDIHRELKARKVSFLGPASFIESMERYLPADIREVSEKFQATLDRELVKDLSMNQAFRRDLYHRAALPTSISGVSAQFASLELKLNPVAQLPKEGEPFLFKSGVIEVKGDYKVYSDFLSLLDKEGGWPTLAQMHKLTNYSFDTLKDMVLLLYGGGWVYLRSPTVNKQETKKNESLILAILDAVRLGGKYRAIPLPNTQHLLNLNEFEMLILDVYIRTKGEFQLEFFLDEFEKSGRVLNQNGARVEDRATKLQLLGKEVSIFTEKISKLKSAHLLQLTF